MVLLHKTKAKRDDSNPRRLKQSILIWVSTQASAVVAAPLLADGVPQPVTGFERVVAHARTHQRGLARLFALAGVVGADAGQRFIGGI